MTSKYDTGSNEVSDPVSETDMKVKSVKFTQIWKETAKIPSGKVVTYGQLAKKLRIADSRIIGWALHANKDTAVPCHRVVDRFGNLAKNYAFGGRREQRKRLLKEGIEFSGKKRVNLDKIEVFIALRNKSPKKKRNKILSAIKKGRM